MVKISIIVPVYNVVKYLEKCLDSLVNQTFQDIEIILIDDASTDDSRFIMKVYEKKSPMIKCIYLDANIGQGEARNKGIEIARGKYIMFVDSDDWIDSTMCEKLYLKSLEEDYDIVGCDYYKVEETTEKVKQYSLYFKQQEGLLDKTKKSSLLFMFSIPVCKLIKKELLVMNHLYFPSKIKYEDFAVVPLYFMYANNIGILDETLYYYLIREGSTSNSKNAEHHEDVIKSAVILYNSLIERGFNDYMEEAEGLYVKQIMNGLNKYVKLYSEIDFDILNVIKEMTATIYPSCKTNRYYYSHNEVGRKVFELLHDNFNQIRLEYEQGTLAKVDTAYLEYYDCYLSKLSTLQEYCKRNNLKVAIWGAGLKGNDFLRIYDDKAENITLVIDKNEEKHGTKTKTGHLISSSNSVCKEIDLVIVMNRNFYASIKKEVKAINNNVKVFNMDMYLLMNNSEIELFFE